MIYLFGSTGMLGCYVKKILSKDFNIVCFTRVDYDVLVDDWNKLYKLLDNVKSSDIIINCIGIIPQKYKLDNYRPYIRVNSLFPHKLQEIVEKKNAKLIHITTDCVYNGSKGLYKESDIHDENNIYGVSKSLGEPENATVIRTSIIGHELNYKKSLLEWIISNKDKEINGYNNHLWNGVTCLQLSIIINDIIKENLFWKGVRHIHSPNIVSKYELCVLINDIYELNIKINKFSNEKPINKTLSSIYKSFVEIPDIRTQIQAQYLLFN